MSSTSPAAMEKLELPAEDKAHGDTSPTSSRIKITHRPDRSAPMAALQFILKPFRPRLVAPSGKSRGAHPVRLKPPIWALRTTHWKEYQVDGTWIYDMVPKVSNKHCDYPKRRIYYFCGGSWQDPPSIMHWRLAAELSRKVHNAMVSVISHPLAPECPACEALPHLDRLYKELMRRSAEAGERVVWAGDSSGGNLALSVVLHSLSTQGVDGPQPAAVMAICAPTDLRHLDDKIKEVEPYDSMMTLDFVNEAASKWTNMREGVEAGSDHSGYSISDPRISPAAGDIGLFAAANIAVHGVTAGFDVLAPEAVNFRDRCAEAGVEGQWLQCDKMMHDFPLMFKCGFSDCQRGLDWIVDVLQTA
ncbi:Alpha/Beta hydrolase protein [Emericellopsis atlantica]|uniref:Alpha/Beta hydrolase protein n=1 Tax=Emericellopsis atlantica TaxID=2614577 RepID=A0A9P8CQ34_9HYPO|nr:Alpha/Beta hydrolase protein [Emericellopsis atlantica]KAG9255524.1 Alpha/Beta hydrolase protein [Emericellopsis atlantica]